MAQHFESVPTAVRSVTSVKVVRFEGLRGLIAPAVVALAYFVSAHIGFSLRFPPATSSVMWPPNAILTVALLLTPRPHWWRCLLAAFLAHLVVELQFISPLLAVVLFATNCSESLIAASFLRRFSDSPRRFDTLRRVAVLIAGAGFLAPFLSSFLDAAAVSLFINESYWSVWRTRFLSNMLTELTIVPAAVFIVSGGGTILVSKASRMRLVEGGALMAGLLVVLSTLAVESSLLPAPDVPLRRIFFLPFLIWAAVRFGAGGTSLVLLVIASVVVWMGTRGSLTFLAMRPEDGVRAVQFFLILQAIPLLCLAAVIDERRQTKESIDERLRFEKLLAHLSRAFVWVARGDLDQRIQQWLKLLGGFFKADHLVLLRVSADRKDLEVFHSWSASADSPVPAGIWEPRLPPEALRKVRRWTGSGGDLLCPLTIEERVLGALALKGAELGGIPRAERARRLELVAEVFANALERKQSEEERERVEFSNRQMREELAHATRLSMMGEIAASLAHELNQPLTGILGNAQAARRMLDMSPPNIDELRAILSDIIADDRRASEMIQRVRNLVRKGKTEMRPLDINVLVRDVARLLRTDAMMRKLEIRLELATDPLLVNGDHAQLQQVIVNLLLNAMDAMVSHPASDGLVVVRTGLAADGSVEIAVRDSGIGLAPSDRIFEPFFTTKPRGMGMGLSITRSIVEAHEGSIRGENCPGGGAVFHVVLPSSTSARGLSAEATRLRG